MTDTKKTKKKRWHDNPWLYLGAAMLMFWVGYALRTPLEAQHRLLVATDQQQGTVFEKSVILMVRDQITGSYGVIVNKPAPKNAAGTGGPVETNKMSVIHSSDVMLSGSMQLGALPVAYSNHPQDARDVTQMPSPPGWYRVLSGYAGWSSRQLSREIRRGAWRVIEYEDRLVIDTPPEKMWAEAMKRPDAKID